MYRYDQNKVSGVYSSDEIILGCVVYEYEVCNLGATNYMHY